MNQFLTRRFFLTAGACASLGNAAFADAPNVSLRPQIRGGETAALPRSAAAPDALIAGAKLGGTVGFAVADLKSGKLLETNNANTALPPASTAKSITALYALATLGANYRFSTRLVTNGSIAGGVLSGDLILVGGGDPTLDTNALAGMAAQLKKLGIREVRGRYLYNDNALPTVHEIDKGQPDHVGYNPAVSGLNLNYNRVHFEWKRAGKGYSVALDARSEKYRPEVTVARMKIANRSLPVYTYKNNNNRDEWTVANRALGKGGSRWLPVRKPGLYAAEVFQTFARSQGIVLRKPARTSTVPKARALVTHTSAPLQTILRLMLKYSTNITAEVVGLTASQKRSGRQVSLKSSAAQMSKWANATLKLGGAKFVDHSGLGADSRVTPQGMVNAMLIAARSGDFSALLKDIPMRDAKRRVIKNHPIKVVAKTGTLNFVSALTGYMTAPDGSQFAFSMICADTKRRQRLKEVDRESPSGGREWNRRAKALQQNLIERWGAIYG